MNTAFKTDSDAGNDTQGAIRIHADTRNHRMLGAAFLILALAILGGWVAWRVREDRSFPGANWAWISPKAAGFDGQRLHSFSARLGGDGCIVYKGRMVHTWGDDTRLNDVASVAKPFYAHFTLKALEDGLIESLDDRVVTWVPELATLNKDLGFKDRDITFRHLLDQTSGYGLREPPGAAFGYNDFQTGLLVWTLFRRVYACGYGGADQALLVERLGRHLRFEDHPTFRHPGSHPGRLRISARDLARFGHLYMMNGQWQGQSVLRKDLVRLALDSAIPVTLPRTQGEEAERFHEAHSIGGGPDQKGHAGAHSFFWWLNRKTADGKRLLPDATPRTFIASGYGGRFAMIVVPEHKLVIVWLDAFEGEDLVPFDEVGRLWVNEAVRELLDARIGKGNSLQND